MKREIEEVISNLLTDNQKDAISEFIENRIREELGNVEITEQMEDEAGVGDQLVYYCSFINKGFYIKGSLAVEFKELPILKI